MGVQLEVRDFFKTPFTAVELAKLFKGRSPAEFLSRRSPKYKELDLEHRQLSDAGLIALMVEEPSLLRRPIVVSGDRIVAGFDPEALEAIATQGG